MSVLVAAVAVLAVTALALVAVTRPLLAVRRRALAGVLIIALAVAGVRVGGTGRPGSLLVGAGLLLLGITLLVVAIRSSNAMDQPTPVPPAARVQPRWLAVQAVAVVLALLSPHLHLVMAGAALAVLSGTLAVRHSGGGWRPPLGLGVALLLLLGAWYALALVGGEAPLWINTLPDAPYSEAFELSVALPLVLAAWPLLGLFPFHDTTVGPLAPLAGGAVIVRVAAEAVPAGLEHWQPLLYPLVLAAMVHALVRRRDPEALTALAALGLVSGAFLVGWCAIGLTAGVALLRGHQVMRASGRVLSLEGEALAQGVAVAAAMLVVPVLSGGLAAETVYTVLVVLCGAFYLWKR